MNIPEIFILWHPACSLGEVLARQIYAWLRPGKGLGPKVYFRSLPAPGALPDSLPLPIPGESRLAGSGYDTMRRKLSELQIVIALIDEHMVASPAWRHWLSQLCSNLNKPSAFLPIALDATAYNAPAEIRELNYLRPTGLPITPVMEFVKAFEKRRAHKALNAFELQLADTVEAIVHSLLKQLTETLTRLILSASQSTNPAMNIESSKVAIFLSHAKVDGRLPAQCLRDYIYSQTQLAAFYDENDIAFSSVFTKVLNTHIHTTAGMIAVRSTRYAQRPWCRREVSLFRRPRQVTARSLDENTCEQWRLHPLLVVEAMEETHPTSGIPEFGNAQTIRWDSDVPDMASQVVTQLVRDIMLGAYHAALGTTIPKQNNHRRRIVLNWMPDPTTVLHVLRGQRGEAVEIVYPGQGLSGSELDVLYEFFPEVDFLAFEEVLA